MECILIVDDDKTALATARTVLSDKYKVVPVMHGRQALEYLSTNNCDLILLDVNMPNMNGFEVLEKIRQTKGAENIPVIFLTADSDADMETKCLDLGAIDFIAKPFVPGVMRSRIARVLELESLRRGLANRLAQKTQEASFMKEKSSKDPLTGLWNRTYTEKAVNLYLEENSKGAFVMIDMDNFKAINDVYGHVAGDEVLIEFARTMEKYSDNQNILCRIGGDEFVIFVKGETDRKQLEDFSKMIISSLEEEFAKKGYKNNASVSIGIAVAPEDGLNFSTLYNAADKALYIVKQSGKGAFHFFDEKDNKKSGTAVYGIDYVTDVLNRTDSGFGAYITDYDGFRNIYNYIRRQLDRTDIEAQMLLFTLGSDTDMDEEGMDKSVTSLEKIIYSNIRHSDVATRYTDRQVLVMVINANAKNCNDVAERICRIFNEVPENGDKSIQFKMTEISKVGILGLKG